MINCASCGVRFYQKDTDDPNCKYCQPPKLRKKNDCRERFDRVKRGAKLRGIPFELSYYEFSEFYGDHCVYCGDLTGTVNLDRINNEKGYFYDNVAPCCPDCNRMKGSLTVDGFLRKINSILNNFADG